MSNINNYPNLQKYNTTATEYNDFNWIPFGALAVQHFGGLLVSGELKVDDKDPYTAIFTEQHIDIEEGDTEFSISLIYNGKRNRVSVSVEILDEEGQSIWRQDGDPYDITDHVPFDMERHPDKAAELTDRDRAVSLLEEYGDIMNTKEESEIPNVYELRQMK